MGDGRKPDFSGGHGVIPSIAPDAPAGLTAAGDPLSGETARLGAARDEVNNGV
jgi:hypothetical protein